MIAAIVLTLIGCAPQDAQITGDWNVWLAANNSGTVDEGKLDVAGEATRVYECSGRGWDSTTGAFDAGYIGPTTGSDYGTGKYFGGACDPGDSSCDAATAEAMSADCALVDGMEFYPFLERDGFYYLTQPIDAWRTEAVINGEGDFQLTVHNRLGSGQDMRFAFVVKPDFAPIDCVDENGDGTAQAVYQDGDSWSQAWSADEDGYTIYYLNAGAQQSSPGELDDYGDPIVWYFPSEWASGFGQAKFASEEFSSRPNRYGIYDEFGVGPHFELSAPSSDDTVWGPVIDRANPDMDAYAATADDLRVRADLWSGEIEGIAMNGIADDDPSLADMDSFSHKVEDNMWRPVNASVPGLDGWMEVSASWVRIKDGSDLSAGGQAEGDFQIYYEGFESSSVLVVRGSFVVDKIHKDQWAYPVLEDDKRDENGTPYCGGATAP